LLSATIAGSFHFVIVPAKIPANVFAERLSVFDLFGRLYKTAIGAATTGTWITVATFVVALCAVSEKLISPIPLSEFPRPVPEPPAPYVNE
jgi:hypothetical protein